MTNQLFFILLFMIIFYACATKKEFISSIEQYPNLKISCSLNKGISWDFTNSGEDTLFIKEWPGSYITPIYIFPPNSNDTIIFADPAIESNPKWSLKIPPRTTYTFDFYRKFALRKGYGSGKYRSELHFPKLNTNQYNCSANIKSRYSNQDMN